MSTTPPHVIFGTGAIGLATLDALRRRGETARMVNRIVDSSTIPDALGVRATPVEVEHALAETLRTYRDG